VATLQANVSGPKSYIPHLAHWVALALITAALGWSYAPNFGYLISQWEHDPNYSYGYFVIPIALVILWTRRGMLDWHKLAPSPWGFLALLALVAARYPLFEWNELFAETATIPLVVGALTLALGGWHLVRLVWPSILFLLFLLPLPPSYNQMLAGPLQDVATRGSLGLLQIIGLPVVAEGNVIWVGSQPLEVARACNGLSMMLSFVTLLTAAVILVAMPVWERVVLLLSTIPIALVSNILRITATALVYYHVGESAGEKLAHDLAGWAMMPIALALVWFELRVMSWLFVEVDEVEVTTAAGLRRPSRH
jgi:exosortase